MAATTSATLLVQESNRLNPDMNRIARRAHEIYQARGGEHGKAMEDWLQAEREIDAAMEESPTDH